MCFLINQLVSTLWSCVISWSHLCQCHQITDTCFLAVCSECYSPAIIDNITQYYPLKGCKYWQLTNFPIRMRTCYLTLSEFINKLQFYIVDEKILGRPKIDWMLNLSFCIFPHSLPLKSWQQNKQDSAKCHLSRYQLAKSNLKDGKTTCRFQGTSVSKEEGRGQ